MTVKELFKHFKDKNMMVDMCTPLYRKIKTIRNFELEFTEKMLDFEVSNWEYDNNTLHVNL